MWVRFRLKARHPDAPSGFCGVHGAEGSYRKQDFSGLVLNCISEIENLSDFMLLHLSLYTNVYTHLIVKMYANEFKDPVEIFEHT